MYNWGESQLIFQLMQKVDTLENRVGALTTKANVQAFGYESNVNFKEVSHGNGDAHSGSNVLAMATGTTPLHDATVLHHYTVLLVLQESLILHHFTVLLVRHHFTVLLVQCHFMGLLVRHHFTMLLVRHRFTVMILHDAHIYYAALWC